MRQQERAGPAQERAIIALQVAGLLGLRGEGLGIALDVDQVGEGEKGLIGLGLGAAGEAKCGDGGHGLHHIAQVVQQRARLRLPPHASRVPSERAC